MKRNLTDTNDNSNSIPTIDTLLNPQDYLNPDTDILGDLAGGDYEAESLSDRSELGARLDTSSYFYANPSGYSPNVATARTDSTLDLSTFLEYLESQSPSTTSTIPTIFEPLTIASPNNEFSIEVTYRAGTEDFTPEMRDAIEDAADVWEDAISQSNFAGGDPLTIEVGGQNQGADGFLAIAGPDFDSLALNANGNVLPTEGFSVVNTNSIIMEDFIVNPDYFETVMTHEFGHVMGIGTLWERNGLIDPLTGNYRANTEAGAVFNSYYPDETILYSIPLTTGEGLGSDGVHWDEEFFGNELMTSRAELPGISHPLSEMTLASLEDIGWNVNYQVAEVFPNVDTPFSHT